MAKMTNKKIIVITGATGTGKTTVQNYLQEHFHIPRVITHTTRPPRKGERNGVDYYFESDKSFPNNHYLEHVQYSGYQYGSSHEGIERAWTTANIVSIVLDTAGAVTYARELGDAAAIMFLTIDDPVILRKRLLDRGDLESMVTQRLASKEYARDLVLPVELRTIAQVIVNDDWQLAQNAVDIFVSKLQEATDSATIEL
jgi:guanylate kinase